MKLWKKKTGKRFFQFWPILLCFFFTLPLFAQTKIRIMAANLTSGPNQSYDPGHGARIFKGLKPDIVLIQEFNIGTNSKEAISAWVGTTFGTDFSYFRETGDGLPNGVISRFPLLEKGEWEDSDMSNRDFAWARIDLPGEQELWAISVHFKAGSASDRRTGEAKALVTFIRKHVPEKDFLVLGGDFNTSSRTESCITVLSEFFRTTTPWPVDHSGNGNTNKKRNKPYDWVLADNDLDPVGVSVVLGDQEFPNGLVFDSRIFENLNKVGPVEKLDSDARQMQHMAVIRDFLIPGENNQQQKSDTPPFQQQ